MTPVQGKVCVVTGAASGIGRALALELARRGARLAISDVGEDGLAETAARTPAEVHHRPLDVTDRDAVERYAEEVAAHFGGVHQVYNNAGIAFRRTTLESAYEDYERVLAVNLWGVIHGTKAFLPHLIASGDGHVCNISSLNGFLAQSGASHYCTSKFAVRGFTEALRAEMAEAGHPVGVTCVPPGGVRTNIADAARERAQKLGLPISADDERRHRLYTEKLLKMDPAEAARTIVGGVERGKGRVLVGSDAKMLDALVRALPVRHTGLVLAGERRLAGGERAF